MKNEPTPATTTASQSSADFVESVLRLQPELAVFDCDGTLWSGDAGEGFFDWELKQGVVSDDIVRWARPRYADYKAGKVSEDEMCGELVTIHRGLAESDVQQAANQYFDETFVSWIFPELRDLMRRLQGDGCDVWAVSSSNQWIIRAAMRHFGIDQQKILASEAKIENGRITDHLIRIPSGEGKPQAIRDVIRKIPDAAFGNSRWDADMLGMARHGFAVNPNPDLETMAKKRGWTIYWPDLARTK